MAFNLPVHGVTTVPVFDVAKLQELRGMAAEYFAGAPEFSEEFRNGTLLPQLRHAFPGAKECELRSMQAGGFGALGLASSFHCPFVRHVRACVHGVAKAAIVGQYREHGVGIPSRFEQDIDRLGVRSAGQKPTAESWHRDESAGAVPGDLVFGGWVNLSSHVESFSCVPGTQRPGQNRGFAVIKDPAEKAAAKAARVLVDVPPGHLIMFLESLVHEVNAKAHDTDMLRLFMGWRLTNETRAMNQDELLGALETQNVIRIKSGQVPELYPKLWQVNFPDKFAWHVPKFIPAMQRQVVVQSGKRQGHAYTALVPTSHSLQELGAMYPEYSSGEIQMLLPQPI